MQVQRYRCVRTNRGVHEWSSREGSRSRGDEFHGQPYIRRINVLIHCWFIETVETTLTDRSGIQLNHLLRDTAIRVNVARIKPLHIPFNRVLLMAPAFPLLASTSLRLERQPEACRFFHTGFVSPIPRLVQLLSALWFVGRNQIFQTLANGDVELIFGSILALWNVVERRAYDGIV